MAGRLTFGCDLFCRVIDNLGDAGVCLRLARQLAAEHGAQVRLIIDRPEVLARIAGGRVPGVEVVSWSEVPSDPAEVVIEAFACDPPEDYVAAMADGRSPPVWINLEYLSAEAWVASHHGLASLHPRLGLVKHFWCPGFDAASGGLLREAGLVERRCRFSSATLRSELGIDPLAAAPLALVFAYPHAPVAELVQACERHGGWQFLAAAGVRVPERLRIRALPYLDQGVFDQLLWSCEVLLIRGEDSFVRAQWAAKPFLWNIYPQADGAHWRKLDAFLQRYLTEAPPPLARALRIAHYAWNGEGDIATAWHALEPLLPHWQAHAERWCAVLAAQPDLASRLVRFVESRLQ